MGSRGSGTWLAIIGAIAAIAVACSAYILHMERVPSPLDRAYEIRATFNTVDAVVPGIGEPVTISGVHVGQISGVELSDGRGVLRLRMERSATPPLHAGTRAALVANTPAKDMQVDLAPGPSRGPLLRPGATIPLALTTTPTDSDELLHALDSDTRDWLRTLIASSGEALHGRARDLRAVLRDLGPTAGQLRQIAGLVAARRLAVRRLVGNVSRLATVAARQSVPLASALRSGEATVGALARQDAALGRSLALLPGTVDALHATLAGTAPFARSLRRTLVALRPTLQRLPATTRALPDAIGGLLPLPLRELRVFTRAAGPLGAHVSSASRDIGAAVGPLSDAFGVLNTTVNAIAYAAPGDDRSYLFWFAWFAHNANSMVSTEDANGAAWRGMALLSCASIAQPGALGRLIHLVAGSAKCP
jgi:phospholipid/cholesterol/gamma-HCH transport system substrate-binding protein